MNNFDELLQRVGLISSNVGYRYLNFGGKALYLAGFQQILQLNADCIIFRLKANKNIYISGKNLSLKEMDNAMVIIVGDIDVVEVRQ